MKVNASETQNGTNRAGALAAVGKKFRSGFCAIIFLGCCHGLPASSVKSNSHSAINYNYIVFIHAVNINHEALRIGSGLLVRHKDGFSGSKEKSPVWSTHRDSGNKSLR